MEQNSIVVKNVTKKFDDFMLDHISFTVPTGRIVGFIGDECKFHSVLNAKDIAQILSGSYKTWDMNLFEEYMKRLDVPLNKSIGQLSKGMKMKLSIICALSHRPQILILDEATSSIDTKTEIRVQRAFEKLMQGKTSFVVAHRLSTIMSADVILVMRDGNIVEQGTHAELMEKGGFYADLYNSQFEQAA